MQNKLSGLPNKQNLCIGKIKEKGLKNVKFSPQNNEIKGPFFSSHGWILLQ